jgi:hypothetical protein
MKDEPLIAGGDLAFGAGKGILFTGLRMEKDRKVFTYPEVAPIF